MIKSSHQQCPKLKKHPMTKYSESIPKWKGMKRLVFKSDVFSVSLTSWHCARYPDLCDYCSVSSSPLSLFLFVEVCPAQGWWVFRQQSKTFTITIQNSWAKCFIKFTQSHIQIYKGRKISVIIKLIQASPLQSLTSSPCQAGIHISFSNKEVQFWKYNN